jgi:hypothetical protein
MKKIGMILVTLVLALTAACADDRIVSPESLPQKAKEFIAVHFSGKTVQYVEKEFNEYEVQLSNRTEIKFKGNGEWETIKSYEGVPVAALPASLTSHVSANFADAKIIEVEKDLNRIEVKLSTGLEVFFDKDGKFLGQKFDD